MPISFLIKFKVEACNLIKNETLAQVFSSEFGEIYKNTFFLQITSGRLLLNIYIYKYYGMNWESVRSKNERIQEILIESYPNLHLSTVCKSKIFRRFFFLPIVSYRKDKVY